MKRQYYALSGGFFAIAMIFSWSGCAMFRAKVDTVNVDEERHLRHGYDYSDMRNFTESIADEIAASDFVNQTEEKPVFMIAGIENRTSRYVDTKNLTDRIRTLLFKTGKIRFVNEARRDDLLKEQQYQSQHAAAETQRQIGQQLGANYMLTGSLTQMKDKSPAQARVSREKVNYYKLTVEVTDLNSGEIVWIDEQELARQLRQPIIRW